MKLKNLTNVTVICELKSSFCEKHCLETSDDVMPECGMDQRCKPSSRTS